MKYFSWIHYGVPLLYVFLVMLLASSTLSQQRTSCSSGFENITTEENKTVCARIFDSPMSWDDSKSTCRRALAYLAGAISQNFSLNEKIQNKGIVLVWLGVRRFNGIYILDTTSEIFGSQMLWEDGEPLHDCVAMNATTGRLVTKDCTMKLPFVCEANGFPVEVSKSVLCKSGWFFSYLLPFDVGRCVQEFPPEGYDDAVLTCLNEKSQLASEAHYALLFGNNSNSRHFNYSGREFWAKETVCEKTSATSQDTNCSDKRPFICIQGFRNIPVHAKIVQEFYESVPSTLEIILLSCILLDNRTSKALKSPFISYQWYKGDIPISERGSSFIIGHYPDPTKRSPILYEPLADKVTWQGTWHCEVQFLGSGEIYQSPGVDIFFSDVATYIINVTGMPLKEYFAYSQQRYDKFMQTFSYSIQPFMERFQAVYPDSTWNLPVFSKDGNKANLKFLLYVNRTIPNFSEIGMRRDLEYILENFSTHEGTLRSADVCFEEEILNSQHSCDNLTWPDTWQTKNVASDPLCLSDENELVTRKCKASTVRGSQWSPFNCSSCAKYQVPIQDLDVQCPDGFQEFKGKRICFRIYDKQTWDDAYRTCDKNSGYFLNDIYDEPDFPAKFWTSLKYLYGKFRWVGLRPDTNRLLSKSIGKKPNPSLQCVSATKAGNGYELHMEDCSEELPFVCIRPLREILSSVKLSATWSKLPEQKTCYHVSSTNLSDKMSWEDAMEVCPRMFPNSELFRPAEDLSVYTLFKFFMNMLLESRTWVSQPSWWIAMHKYPNKKKWPLKEAKFYDWSPHANFNVNNPAATLTFQSLNVKKLVWAVADEKTAHGYICQIPDCEDNRPTNAYIEVWMNLHQGSSTVPSSKRKKIFDVRCVPSGLFLHNSFNWFQDGIPLEEKSDRYSIDAGVTKAGMDTSVKFQGYYWCSVDKPSHERVFSSKVLFRLPSILTYVVSMQSENEAYINTCVDFMTSDSSMNDPLMECFKKSLKNLLPPGLLHFMLKNISCVSMPMDIQLHIYYSGKNMDERNLLQRIQNSNFGELYETCKITHESISVKSTVACHEEETSINGRKIIWPTTPVGTVANPQDLCLTDDGEVLERQCLGDFNVGARWADIYGECSDSYSNITMKLRALSQENATAAVELPSLRKLSTITATPQKLQEIDILYVARYFQNIADASSIMPQNMRWVLSTADNIIAATRFLSDSSELKTNSSSRILESLENVLSNLKTDKGEFQDSRANIATIVHSLRDPAHEVPNCVCLTEWNKNLTTFFNVTNNNMKENITNYKAAIVIPNDLVNQQVNDSSAFVCTMHENFFPVVNMHVVSPVITVKVTNRTLYNLNPPINLFFNLSQMSEEDYEHVKCVFWDQSLNSKSGGWSYKGCFTFLERNGSVRCSCDHLTSFAIVLDWKPTEISEPNRKALSYITYIGCSLSCFGLGVIIITFLLFSSWRKDVKNKALFNLSLSLMSFFLTFMFGSQKTSPELGCIVVSILLHFFLLSSFAWMAVAAFLQYLSLVKVFRTYIPSFIQKAAAFAWGLPAVIVILMLSIKYELYIRKGHYCWLSGNVFYYAVALPVLAMLTANFIIFGLILYSNTCGKPDNFLRSNQNARKLTIARAKALFCISILLGLSWIFGFLAIDDAKLPFQYLFAVTASLQGFLVFIIFVARQKSTCELWKNFLYLPVLAKKSQISNISGSMCSNTNKVFSTDVHFITERDPNSSRLNEEVPYVSFTN